MKNQVTIEGYVVSQWVHQNHHYIRIANNTQDSNGELLGSDYVTVRIPQGQRLQQGDMVLVQGRVWGKDVIEPLAKVLRKSRLNIEIPADLARVMIPRPTTLIDAISVQCSTPKAEAQKTITAKVVKKSKKPPSQKKTIKIAGKSRVDMT